MSITMYSASAPILVKMLSNLSSWLDKAEAFSINKKFDVQILLDARLAPDMLPLTRQIQIASDCAKFGMARLAAEEAPRMEDTEGSVSELKLRIQRTIDYIQSVPAYKVEGSEQRSIQVPMRGKDALHFQGQAYLAQFVLPNFFFHVTTSYAILRHNGVELEKADFLGAF